MKVFLPRKFEVLGEMDKSLEKELPHTNSIKKKKMLQPLWKRLWLFLGKPKIDTLCDQQ